ncbi:response regulator transcription factor [Trichothermofontia sichuanensis B231]|uniref:response regulator transcription factor n=1 Tax=Trichothermofontia sichuanensis TaxID=3045816 RepID=UPI002246FA67|nr:response regulator transcription factor [Trichothermofontia sichuanensis]UZQ53147.1 response regulator transcription factor [Trichothermofontia sichuanensis B231]
MPLLILVAEDDPGTRLTISDYLEQAGYSVVSATNGREALQILKDYLPHLLITDVAMPHMDGFELVKRVRQQPHFRLLPVIFLTAHSTTKERIQGYQLGCDIYLPKPFDLSELGAVVRNLMERTQLIQTEWRTHLKSAEVESPPTSGGDRAIAKPTAEEVALTPREQDVLHLLAEGLSNSQIGEQLHLSPRTVEKHVSSLLRKSNTSNRAELVRFAIDNHLVR